MCERKYITFEQAPYCTRRQALDFSWQKNQTSDICHKLWLAPGYQASSSVAATLTMYKQHCSLLQLKELQGTGAARPATDFSTPENHKPCRSKKGNTQTHCSLLHNLAIKAYNAVASGHVLAPPSQGLHRACNPAIMNSPSKIPVYKNKIPRGVR